MALAIYDNLWEKDVNNRYRGLPLPGLVGGVYNYSTGTWTSDKFVILQEQWWNDDAPFPQVTPWAETEMAAAAAACVNASIVIWDLDNEGFYSDSLHTSEPTTSINRQFVFDTIDELRSRCDPATQFGYYAALPFKYHGLLNYSELSDAAFHARPEYATLVAMDNDYIAAGFADHFDMLCPEVYPWWEPFGMGFHAAYVKRMVEELDRVSALTGLEKMPYLHTHTDGGVTNPLTGEQMMDYLKSFEAAGLQKAILYWKYMPGSAHYRALNDFLHLTRQTVRTKTYCLFGDSQTSANNLSYSLQTALHRATRAVHWREDPAKLVSASRTVAAAASGIVAELAAVSGYVDEVLINLGGYDLASLPAGATFRANFATVLDAFHNKWGATVRVAYPWQSGYDTEAATVAGYIDTVLSTRTAWASAGIDIQTAIEGHTSGADPDATGTAALAAAWAALLTA